MLALARLVLANSESDKTPEEPLYIQELEVLGRSYDALFRTSSSGFVIHADEILTSGASNILDVLQDKANLNLQSFNGTGKNASIDIRGMGATSVSNVLLLVDGQRLNNEDLSGADFSTISLQSIQRIEVIRGGGNVRYGNGAVGGVINIITRKPETRGLHGAIHFQTASYHPRDTRISLGLSHKNLTLSTDIAESSHEGFRENGGLERYSINTRLRYSIDDWFSTDASISYSSDQAGLPGPVSLQQFRGTRASRQATQSPFDYSDTEELRIGLGYQVKNERLGSLSVKTFFRERKNPFILGFNPNQSVANQIAQTQVRSLSLSLNYKNTFTAFNIHNALDAGIESHLVDYLRREDGTSLVDASQRREGKVRRNSAFLSLTHFLNDRISLHSAYRLEHYASQQRDKTLRQVVSTCDTKTITIFIPFPVSTTELINCQNRFIANNRIDNEWINHAGTLGVEWDVNEKLKLFSNIRLNFRSPNVDELLFASNNLGPQQGFNKEVGLRFNKDDRFSASLVYFDLETRDEIVFANSPAFPAGINRNLDTITERKGMELETKIQATPDISLRANLGYVRPRLVDQKKDIPLVPRVTASSSIQYTLHRNTTFQLLARHVSKRLDGNDFGSRQFPRLKPYTVFDVLSHYQKDKFQLFAGIKNLSNEVYSTLAYSATYYPMPERTAYAGFHYAF